MSRTTTTTLALLLAATGIALPLPSSGCLAGTLDILVHDGSGEPLEGAQLTLRTPTNLRRLVSGANGRATTTFPAGSVTIQVRHQGFSEISSVVEVQTEATLVPIVLTVAPVESPRERVDGRTVSGTLSAFNLGDSVGWLRLVSLYGRENYFTLISIDGTYSVPKVRFGKYQTIVVSGKRIWFCGAADVDAVARPVNFAINKCREE